MSIDTLEREIRAAKEDMSVLRKQIRDCEQTLEALKKNGCWMTIDVGFEDEDEWPTHRHVKDFSPTDSEIAAISDIILTRKASLEQELKTLKEHWEQVSGRVLA